MAKQLFVNNAASVLATEISAAATSLTLAPGHGARFPAPTNGDWFTLTLYQMAGPNEVNHEIVKCVARDADTCMIVRAQEGTTARAFNGADPVSARVTAGALAPASLGLGSVDNTSDANKAISNATQAALDTKAPVNAPTFTNGATVGTTAAPGVLGIVTNGATFEITPDQASGANGVLLNTSFANGGAGPIKMAIGGSEKMRIDPSGAVGIGMTPKAWGHTALQVKAVALSESTDGGESTYNAYKGGDSVWRTIASGGAARYVQAGSHRWYVANAAANAPLTWAQIMTLNAAGDLGIGVENPLERLHVNGGVRLAGSLTSGTFGALRFAPGKIGTKTPYAGIYGGVLTYNMYPSGGGFKSLGGGTGAALAIDEGHLTFATSNGVGAADADLTFTDRLVVTPQGNVIVPTGDVGVGTDSPTDRMHVKGGKLRIEAVGQWFLMGSNATEVSYGTFLKGNTATVVGLLGTDGGGIAGGGTGNNFGIRAEADLMLMAGASERMRILAGGGALYHHSMQFNCAPAAGVQYEMVNRTGAGFDFYVNAASNMATRIDANGNLLVGSYAALNAVTDVATFNRAQNNLTNVMVNNQSNEADAGVQLALEAYGGSWRLNVPVSTANRNPLIFKTTGALGGEAMRLDGYGNLKVGHIGEGNLHVISKGTTTVGVQILDVAYSTGFFVGNGYGLNSAAACQKLMSNQTTGRALNAAGTVNASGADYAEYMTKAEGCMAIAKGQIVGVNAGGMLTDKWADAVSFLIKSTDPSYVGGDVWGSEAALGLTRPVEPVFTPPNYAGATDPGKAPVAPEAFDGIEPIVLAAPVAPGAGATEEEHQAYAEALAAHEDSVVAKTNYDAALAAHQEAMTAYEAANAEYKGVLALYEADQAAHQADVTSKQQEFDTVTFPAYQAELEAFEAALEAARQKVDRIAYCGQVPVNVTGATPGQYVVPVQEGDGIGGQLVNEADVTFAEYRRAVGVVQNILPDGRANVRVKVV